jgi:cytochrome c-type biogenesis protein CcmH
MLLLLALLFGGTVYAQEPVEEVSDDEVNRVARELYCPICENTPLDVCETQACEDWRQLIREKLQAGQSDEDIIAYFADIYGERARAMPSTEGFSLIVWVAPVIVAIIGLIVFARLLRRWLARGAVASPTIPLAVADKDTSDTDEYVARLEKDIKESL